MAEVAGVETVHFESMEAWRSEAIKT